MPQAQVAQPPSHWPFKLGKRAARPGSVKLAFRKYANLSVLPTPPAEFGHERLVITPWGVLGNNRVGNCVWAGAAHETMIWNLEAGSLVGFTDEGVISDYSAATGYDPSDPTTDQGSDMQAAASYRQKVGIVDSQGRRHKIGPYLSIPIGDEEAHLVASYLFGAVGIGIYFPDYAMDQFTQHLVWDVKDGGEVLGGHYVPLVARRAGNWVASTWGQLQPMTDQFFRKYNEESLVYLSPEMFEAGGKSLEGFDYEQLRDDLAELQGPKPEVADAG